MKALTSSLGASRTTALLFAAIVALMLVMQAFFPAELAIPLPGSDIRPVLLFEFATAPEHLAHVFGEIGDPLREGRIAGMNIGNAIDYPFMLVYGLFMLSFFAVIARRLPGGPWMMFGWLGMIAAASDAIENAILFSITADLADPLREMAILPYPVWTKFGLLALCCGGAAWAFARLGRWISALLSLPAAILFIPGMLDPFGLAPLTTALIGLGWIAMGVYAVREWLAQRRSA